MRPVSGSRPVTTRRFEPSVSSITSPRASLASDGTSDTYYLTTDHLGSTDRIVKAASGTVQVAESFTAFGQRRGSDWTGGPSAADLTAIGNSTPDGFTGHAMLDGVGLIHMAGRVYDPTVGRFLSVDPLVRDAAASQSWNGYG
jgi:RHS repeat-associated protein